MASIAPPRTRGKSESPGDAARAAKSLASVIERRVTAPRDYADATRELFAARLSGDAEKVERAESQFDAAAEADASARADSAAIFLMMLRDAIGENPGTVATHLFGLPPGLALLNRVESIEDQVAELQNAFAGSAVLL